MTTPTERLAARKALQECRVCAWLATLTEKDHREWHQAIANPRFGATLVASEITSEMAATDYSGPPLGESSILNHRNRGHR
jgi:hypothetical protein